MTEQEAVSIQLIESENIPILFASDADKITRIDHIRVWLSAFGDRLPPKVVVESIGPVEARELLALNMNNRSISSLTVQKYVRDIKAARFVSLNGQSIKLAKDRLLDGQHRLTAIAAVGFGRYQFIVIRDLNPEAFTAMDRGESKSFALVLRDRGIPNAGTVAAATRIQYYWEACKFTKEMSAIPPTNAELDDVLTRNPDIKDCLEYNARLRNYITPGMIAWLELQLKRVDAVKAREFFEGLASGANLDLRSPILVLRKKLEDQRAAKTGPRGKQGIVSRQRRPITTTVEVSASLDGDDFQAKFSPKKASEVPTAHQVADNPGISQLALVITAWNRWVRGQSASPATLSWRPEMKFPTPLAPLKAQEQGNLI